MSDPRVDPNYRGIKCKGCGEYLPTLLTDLCSYCTHERDKNEIERLERRVEELKSAMREDMSGAKANCGKYGGAKDCSDWVDRGLRCSDCPVEVWLSSTFRALAGEHE